MITNITAAFFIHGIYKVPNSYIAQTSALGAKEFVRSVGGGSIMRPALEWLSSPRVDINKKGRRNSD